MKNQWPTTMFLKWKIAINRPVNDQDFLNDSDYEKVHNDCLYMYLWRWEIVTNVFQC